MPNETLQAFINAFAKLPQRVFWKWEAKKPENIPPNVMMTKWLPQQDLIGTSKNQLYCTKYELDNFHNMIFKTYYQGIRKPKH